MPAWKRIRHRLELAGVYLLTALPSVLPLKLSVKLGGFLGILAFDVFRIRRGVTLGNLKRAFKDRMDSAKRVRTGRRSYVNFAKSMVEFASLRRIGPERLERLVLFSGMENLNRALSGGRGVIVVTGHFGSWELLGAAAAAAGLPVDFLVGEQTNKLVDSYINRLRREAGIGTIPVGVSLRGIFSSLRKNRMVAMLSDQDARGAGVFVDFFGIPSSTYPGAAQFAYKTGCPVLFCYIVRRSDETHRAVFLPPLKVNTEAEKENEILRITAAHARALEEVAAEHPDQYFWAHRRWKTRPSGADSSGQEG